MIWSKLWMPIGYFIAVRVFYLATKVQFFLIEGGGQFIKFIRANRRFGSVKSIRSIRSIRSEGLKVHGPCGRLVHSSRAAEDSVRRTPVIFRLYGLYRPYGPEPKVLSSVRFFSLVPICQRTCLYFVIFFIKTIPFGQG